MFSPGDPQGGKLTSTTHDQHDPSKEKGLDGQYGTNLKEIGEKMNKYNKNSEIGLIGIGIGNSMLTEEPQGGERTSTAEFIKSMDNSNKQILQMVQQLLEMKIAREEEEAKIARNKQQHTQRKELEAQHAKAQLAE